jgi:hypothetical protein
MNKKQYRAVVVAQKEQSVYRGKLIHLLINYRSFGRRAYPYGFKDILRQIKKGQKLFDGDGLWYFYQLEGRIWNQPNFKYLEPVGKGQYAEHVEHPDGLPF